MSEGIFRLGEVLAGGGVDREGAYLDGLNQGSQINQRRAQTQSAMQQARLRAQKADARERIREAAADAGFEPSMGDLLLGELGGEFASASLGQERQQGIGFRDKLADPTLSIPERQGAGLALRGDPVTAGDMLGPGGELVADIFNPSQPLQTTATGEAAIAADEALAGQRLASAALSDERRTNPAAFRAAPSGSPNGDQLLSDLILPGGEGTTIVDPNIDASAGFGIESNIKGSINSIVDFLGGGAPYDNTKEAQNALSELSARTQIALRADVPGGRPPVMVQELLARYAEDPSQLFRGDELARENLRTTRDSLERSRQRMRQMLDSPVKKTPTRQQQLEESYLALSDTVADYSAILDSLERAAGGESAPALPAPGGNNGGWTITEVPPGG